MCVAFIFHAQEQSMFAISQYSDLIECRVEKQLKNHIWYEQVEIFWTGRPWSYYRSYNLAKSKSKQSRMPTLSNLSQ